MVVCKAICMCVCVCVLRNDQRKVQWQQIWTAAQHSPSPPVKAQLNPEKDSPTAPHLHLNNRHAHPRQI